MRITLHHLLAGLVPWALQGLTKQTVRFAKAWTTLFMVGLLLGANHNVLAQTCNQVVNFSYSSATDGDRIPAGSNDKLSPGTPGTTVTYGSYTGTPINGGSNTFAVGPNTVLDPTAKFLVWQRNVVGGGPTSDVATVVFTFSRPVSNLTLTLADIDKDLVTASFIDRMTLNAYNTAVGGTLIDLQKGDVTGPGINFNNAKFVGTGSGSTAATDPAFKLNTIQGIGTSNALNTGDVTVSFSSPVQRIEFTYENIAPFATATTDRTHTMGFETITFCAQGDVYANITGGPTSALPGSSATYTAQFGNTGPDNADRTTRTVTIPAGATVTSLGGGTLIGNVLDFGTVTSPAGSSASFTYTYTLPSTTAVYNATTTATTTTAANENGATANNTSSRTTVVTPITDLSTTISGPASATQGNQVTLNVTTTNNGPAPSAGVVQTVQLPTGLANVFVSNNGTYTSGTGLVTFPALTTLASGQTVGNYISFTAPATAFAPVALVTPNTAATGDSNPANNTAYLNGATASTNLTINPVTATSKVANLYTTIVVTSPAVTSPANTATVRAGTDVTLSVLTANAGPAASPNVVETVQLLPGFTASTIKINGAASTGSGAMGSNELLFANGNKYNTVTGLVTFASIPSLASAGSATNTITFTAPANVGDQILATATVSSTSTDATLVTVDPVPADNEASTKVTVLPTADLTATVAGPSSVLAGQAATYTATFTNNGPSTATNPVATVQLPALLTNVQLSVGTYNAATGVVTIPNQATAPAGAAQLMTITFTPLTTGNYPVAASYSSTTPDGVANNNTAKTTTTVNPAADVTVTLSAPATAGSGAPITYVSQTTNKGPFDASNVVTTIQLPIALNPVTSPVTTSAGGSYNAATGLVTFTALSITNGTTVTNFATFTNPNANNTVPLTSVAKVSSSTADPVPGNNTSATTTTNTTGLDPQQPAYDLTATVTTATATPVAPGSSVTLVATYNETGGNDLANVSEVLYLPPGTPISSITVNGTQPATVASLGTDGYNQTTGVLTFGNGGDLLASNGPDSYTVVFNAPAKGTSFSVVANITSPYREATGAATTNNRTLLELPLAQPAAPTGYDEVTAISGPVSALPGTVLTYTVQAINSGPASSQQVQQTVTLPSGVIASNITGGGTQSGNVITFPAFTGQAAGPGGIVTNTFTVTMPALGSLVVNASLTATGETGTTANNSASTTTTQANQSPVAASVVNALQAPQGNTAGQLPISALVATDADGTIAGFQLTSIPNAATQGTLYYNNGGTYTAITSATQALTPAQAASLKFGPVTGYVGNVFFGYTATDNLGAVGLPVLYTIQVGQDTNSLYTVLTKGGNANQYQNGDAVAKVFDVNGGNYTSAGAVNPATGGNGVASASLPATGPAGNPTNALPAGIAFDPASGQFTVSNRTLLRTGTYNLRITTVDLFGGTNTQNIALVIGANPLPVELVSFTAQAVKNADAALVWRTASEKNNDHFDVERSLNGTYFVKIGQVKGQGNATAPTDYALTDAGIGAKANGPVYYRLQQVDADGTRTYSPVRTVAFAKTQAASFTLYPNPATTIATLDLAHLPAGTYQLTVLDLTGRRVLSAPLDALVPRVDLRSLSQGAYLVQITGTADGQFLRLTQRLTKE